MSPKALIIANGESPSADLLRALVADVDLVVCADGGANTALRHGVRPHAIVGDLDSIAPPTLEKFGGVPIHQDKDEYSTDLEKAVRWTIGQGCRDLTICAALGDRIDHTVGNLGVLPKFHGETQIRIVDERGELTYVGRETRFTGVVGEIVSLLPLNRCEGITTSGLRYGLQDDTLELGTRDGTSNIVVAPAVTIRVLRGHLLLYRVQRAPA